MRLVWLSFIGSALGWCGGLQAAGTEPALDLHECRLEHPLRLASLAARCGTLSVPEEPAAVPAGAIVAGAGNPDAMPAAASGTYQTIGLRVAVVRALNRHATAAPLFLLAGGPGQAASDLYTSYAGAFARINRNHDIVLVDQRGTGKSAPLSCTYPDDWQDSSQEMAALEEATRTCLAKFGDRVRFYTTSVAVQDLDRVRRALGYDQIDLYGSSYGTRVAQLYMRRYPNFTHAVILDGVTYPEQAIGPATPADAERALDLIVERCEKTPQCTAAFPHFHDELAALRRRFGTDKQTLQLVDPSDGQPLPLEFNRGVFNAALRFLSYNSTEASLLPALVHEAAEGRLAPLASQTILMARQIGDQLASGMQNTVVCSEDEPFFDAAQIDRAAMSRTYQGSDQLDALEKICKIWPHGPVDPDLHAALHSDIPTLLLSGEADPVTPPSDAERAAQGLTHHRHLVLEGEGHGQIAAPCMPRVMAAFLDDADPRALDAHCLDQHRSAPFFIGLTGPAP